MGFLYTLDATVSGYQVTSMWDNLSSVMNGFYMTPTNQPDPHNLRWVNIICDMLIPQRGILGGWTMLMPCPQPSVASRCAAARRTTRARWRCWACLRAACR